MHKRSQYLSINIGGKLHYFDKVEVMAIVNFTPDSLFQGSRYNMEVPSGAFCIDFGAYSTRPGAEEISESEEIKRIDENLPILMNKYPDVAFSVDTFRPSVAKMCIEKYGVHIINDISGGCDEMFNAVAEYKVPYILTYPDGGGLPEMMYFFSKQIDALTKLGVNDIILDPGFGFGKTLEENYDIARNLHALHTFELPILVGISRKSMIQKVLQTSPSESLNGTSVLHTMLLDEGIDILRVHDVKEAMETIKLHTHYNKL